MSDSNVPLAKTQASAKSRPTIASQQPTEAHQIDQTVDVLIVGAGLSGIGAACHLMRARPHSTYAVLEARADLGGTWDLFRYPGIRSDSDMFTLGYSFRPWRDRRAIADGPSILSYLRDTAKEYGVDQKIRYGHRVTGAAWDSEEGRWIVTAVTAAEHGGDPVVVRIKCGWLSVCSGYYRYDQGHRPYFEGEETFTGKLISPQAWPGDLDWTGKRVAVIGSGATAITLVPTLAKKAKKVTMLQRTPTYIVSVPAEDKLVKKLQRMPLPSGFTSSLIFWKNVLGNIFSYEFAKRFPNMSRNLIRKETERELGRYLDVDKHFSPPYDPWDQRVCAVPDGDLFEAIREGTAAVVTDTIKRFVPDGIETTGGALIEADIVVAATGLQMVPLGGMSISVDGVEVPLGDTLVYKGMMLSGVPNFNLVIGYTNNSWTLKADLVSRTIARLITHLDRNGYDYVRPRAPVSGDRIPFVDLRSGYVQRSIADFPKQGSRTPWRLHQNYLFDIRLFRRSFRKDKILEFCRCTKTRTSARLSSPGKGHHLRAFDFTGTAIITGAASGIGRSLARKLALRGCDLVLVDRDENGLLALVSELSSNHPAIGLSHYVADLTNRDEVRDLGKLLVENHPRTRLLINNAGVALSGTFTQASKEDFDWLLAVNLMAPVDLVRTLLPIMRKNDGPHIVNVSSVFGLVAPAGNVAYATSKFALRGFSEALRAELALESIGVTCVHPGGIKTNISLGSRIGSVMTPGERAAAEKSTLEFDKLLTITPEAAADAIINGVAKRRPRVLIGASAKIPDLFARLFPAHYHGMMDSLEALITRLSFGKNGTGESQT